MESNRFEWLELDSLLAPNEIQIDSNGIKFICRYQFNLRLDYLGRLLIRIVIFKLKKRIYQVV